MSTIAQNNKGNQTERAVQYITKHTNLILRMLKIRDLQCTLHFTSVICRLFNEEAKTQHEFYSLQPDYEK